jgi:hypothetical protein
MSLSPQLQKYFSSLNKILKARISPTLTLKKEQRVNDTIRMYKIEKIKMYNTQ